MEMSNYKNVICAGFVQVCFLYSQQTPLDSSEIHQNLRNPASYTIGHKTKELLPALFAALDGGVNFSNDRLNKSLYFFRRVLGLTHLQLFLRKLGIV